MCHYKQPPPISAKQIPELPREPQPVNANGNGDGNRAAAQLRLIHLMTRRYEQRIAAIERSWCFRTAWFFCRMVFVTENILSGAARCCVGLFRKIKGIFKKN